MKPLISYYFYRLDSFYDFCESIKQADCIHTKSRPELIIPDIIYLPAAHIILSGALDEKSAVTKHGSQYERFHDSVRAIKEAAKSNSVKPSILISLPYVARGEALVAFKKSFSSLYELADGFLLQNIGDNEIITELMHNVRRLCINSDTHGKSCARDNPIIAGDYAFNITNSASASFWSGKLKSIAISPELEAEEQLMLASKFPSGIIPEIIADKNVIVMRSEHCFAAQKEGYKCGLCGRCGNNAPALKDIHGKIYRIICNPLDCSCALLAPAYNETEKNDFTVKGITGNLLYRKAERLTGIKNRPLIIRRSFY